jgi:predicted nucleotidyltransferase
MASGTLLQPTGERERVVELLRGRAAELRAQGIRGLALFGSVARGEARPGSDVDLLVDLDRGAELGFGVVSLQQELDRLVGRPVGLAFASRISPDFRARIERDLVRVF